MGCSGCYPGPLQGRSSAEAVSPSPEERCKPDVTEGRGWGIHTEGEKDPWGHWDVSQATAERLWTAEDSTVPGLQFSLVLLPHSLPTKALPAGLLQPGEPNLQQGSPIHRRGERGRPQTAVLSQLCGGVQAEEGELYHALKWKAFKAGHPFQQGFSQSGTIFPGPHSLMMCIISHLQSLFQPPPSPPFPKTETLSLALTSLVCVWVGGGIQFAKKF